MELALRHLPTHFIVQIQTVASNFDLLSINTFCNNSQRCFKRTFSLSHSSVVMSGLIEMEDFKELLFDEIHWTSLERRSLTKIGLDLFESLLYLPSLMCPL